MKIPKSVMNLCMPAKIYLGLTLFSTLCYLGMMFHAESERKTDHVDVHTYTYLGLFMKLAFAIVWVVFLNYLCSKGHTRWAWFLLVMPFVLMAFFVIMTMFVVSYSVGMMKHVNNQVKDLKDQHATDMATQKQGLHHDMTKMQNDMASMHHSQQGPTQVEGFSL